MLKIASTGALSPRNWREQTAGVRWGEKVDPGATYRATCSGDPDKLDETANSFQQRRGRLDLHLGRVTDAGMWGTDRGKADGKGSVWPSWGEMTESPKWLDPGSTCSTLLASSASGVCSEGKDARGSPILRSWWSRGDSLLVLSVWRCICMGVLLLNLETFFFLSVILLKFYLCH